ncbi:TonB-dependent receptor domain-containing protein [Sphingosinicella rhizophila]|uniref:TonB-dependent receptor n=1 Tax=Sphingosinicella rhizophila TaxID=3050082 RepID=A0ABU3Q8V5_9SPHN|nr:TonB-dependent receptor [Sphingosinicella sp. GR2756]MDT9599831.1 TonB-dependent receptor [Sphingosinicella sp. GR2756]
MAADLLLNDELEGFEIGAQTGISTRGDGEKYLFEGSFGAKFADGRGHFMIGADYLKDEGVIPGISRPLIGATAFVPGPDGKLYPTANITESNRTQTGLINTGVLAGQVFNNDGTLRAFQYGTRRPGAPTLQIDSPDPEAYNTDQYRSLSAPIQRANVFARASFDVTDNLNLWVEGSFNRVWDQRVYFPDLGVNQITIQAENPFLRQDIRDQLAAAGETSFVMGRALTDVSLARYKYSRESIQGSIGFDGRFGGGKWRYNAFYTHGEQTQNQRLRDITLRTEFNAAVDAVQVGGQIVCRINADANPNNNDPNCRPLNLFGNGNASAEAIDYVTEDWNVIAKTWLDHVGASISGEAFQLWNRPVSVAAGVEYREESFSNSYDPFSLASRFNTINGVNIAKTGNNVKEAFAEVNIPLLADLPIVQELNFNGAARISDYSDSGSIWSWKLGLVWNVIDGLKLRGTRSRDIRAAAITELFAQRGTFFTNVSDLGSPGNPTTQVILRTGGNPDLSPEIADTLTVGAVLSPRFMPGFNFSIDYFDIKIEDVITTLSAQQIVNTCYLQNNQGACDQLVRVGGVLSEINASFINIANFRNKGIDLEASYRTRMEGIGLPGQLHVRALANYVDTLVLDNGVAAIEGAGYLGAQAVYLVPKWRGLLSTTYESERFGSDIRARYVGGGEYAPASVLPNQGDNRIAARTYIDLGLRGYFPIGDDRKITIYGSVQNLFDRDPALGAVGSPYHDLIGRYFTFGVRANF